MMVQMYTNMAARVRWFTLPFARAARPSMAVQLNRIGFGCEIDPGYLAVELERSSSLRLKPELWRCQ
jgi:hypothetical protein